MAFTELVNSKNLKLMSKFSQEARQDFHGYKIGKENLKTRLLEKIFQHFSILRKLRPERTGKGSCLIR